MTTEQSRTTNYLPRLLLLALLLLGGTLSGQAADPAPAPPPAGLDTVPPPKDLAELRVIEDRARAVVAKVLPSVVGVQVGASQGSGVIVSKEGLVMTAGHVVGKPGQPVTFRLANGKTVKGTALGIYGDIDAGMMKITDPGDWPAVEKGRSAALKLGAWCVTVGHPLGYQPSRPPVVRLGRLLRAEATSIQTDCPIVAGDSGGPVFDLDGRVIGINSRIGAGIDQNIHVPVDIFTDNWDWLVKGEQRQPVRQGRDADPIKSIFRPIVGEAARCVARIKCDGQETCLGTIVGPDGWILTKASELRGKIVCRLPDQREVEARTVGIQEEFDLAMLKVETTGLPAVPWIRRDPGVGQWVATLGLADVPISLGIVSVPRRAIPRSSAMIGVVLADTEGGAKIESVLAGGPAEKAGLKAQDVIVHVDGKPVKNREEASAAIKSHKLGESVKITYKRGQETKELEIKTAKVDNPGTRRRDMQNVLGVGVSRRSDAFPVVLQHDSVVKPADCGGPVVDLEGKVIGVNIAHAGRTETYCVPTDVLLPLMYDLMSGRLAPPKPAVKVEAKPEAKPAPKPEAKPAPKVDAKPEPKPVPKPEAKPEPKPVPKLEAKPDPKPAPKPEPKVEAKPEPKPVPKPEAKPEPKKP